MRRLAAAPLIALLHAYRWTLSPLLASFGARCRFEPSCSRYAIEAIELHGPVRGVAFAARRLVRCQPWGSFGHDPVPPPGDAIRF
jgi:putative membrane protein insertion efficiency factor